MDLDDATALLEAFLDAEWAATVANYTGSDDALDRARRDANRLRYPDPRGTLDVGVDRLRGMPVRQIEALRSSLDAFARRVAFAVVEHRHPSRGALFGGYVGSIVAGAAGAYDRIVWMQEIDGRPYVVAIWVTDRDAPGLAFVPFSGQKLGDVGPVVGVRRLTEPADPASRAHWEALS